MLCRRRADCRCSVAGIDHDRVLCIAGRAEQRSIRSFVSVSADKSSDLFDLFVFNGLVAGRGGGGRGERSIRRSCRKETRVKKSSKRDRDPLHFWTSTIDRFATDRINFIILSSPRKKSCRALTAFNDEVSRLTLNLSYIPARR